jgi:ElaB/YqjD/DUF883 family membrane-anchored ribosome-binding protein
MGTPINRLESIWPPPRPVEVSGESETGSWGERAKSWENKLESLMAEHPKVAIVTAAGIGLILGWMVKRK